MSINEDEIIKQGYFLVAETLNLMEKAGEALMLSVTPMGDPLVVGNSGAVVLDGNSGEWSVRD